MLSNEVMIKLNCLADRINKRREPDFASGVSFVMSALYSLWF